jgi:hypothetical protein
MLRWTDDYDAVIGLNVRDYFLAQAAVRGMVAEHLRATIHIGSQMGHVGDGKPVALLRIKWALG